MMDEIDERHGIAEPCCFAIKGASPGGGGER